MQMPLVNPEMCQPEITLDFKVGSRFSALRFGMLYKPVNNRINVGGVFAWDHETANFSVSNWFQIPAHQKQEHSALK